MHAPRRLALITGAAGGLGRATAEGLLAADCDVVLTDLNAPQGELASRDLSQQFPHAQIRFLPLDLSDLDAIQAFCLGVQAQYGALDILINNAGLFPTFTRRATNKNCELGFGVGFYGHFALTAQLLPLLLAAPSARVVTISSIAHSAGRIDPQDPLLTKNYDANKAYSACKLACLIFARELDRQAREHGASLFSLAAHPGISRTTLGQYSDNVPRNLRQRAIGWAMRFAMSFLGQDADTGALPAIYAATAAGLNSGQFIGPDGFAQFKGQAAVVKPNVRTLQKHDAAAIWLMAEQYTGQYFEWPKRSL